jgi:H+/Cl- antiporter ClcA
MMMEPWFDPIRFGVLYGGIGGGILGSLGGILGAAAGNLAPKGKGRTFILGAFTLLMWVGMAHLLVGIYALIAQQPYGIWFPLVLVGAVLTVVIGALRPVVRKRYEEAELRKMDAAAFRRG